MITDELKLGEIPDLSLTIFGEHIGITACPPFQAFSHAAIDTL
jgi:hypothetical protein